MNIVQVGCEFDPALPDPDALLDSYMTLTGWSEAIAAFPSHRVTVVHRFHRDAQRVRGGVDYRFLRDGAAGRPRRWQRLDGLVRAAVEAHPDVVHINGLHFAPLAARLRRRLPPQAVILVQDHGGRPPERRRSLAGAAKRLAWRRGLQWVDGFLFTASEQADPWREAGAIAPAQRIYQVLEASTTLRPVPRDRARRATGAGGSPAVLWVGRLNPNKDPLTILDGFELGLAELPDATLTLIYGEAELEAAVRQRVAASPRLRDRVRLAGRVARAELPAFYSAADLFVLGSHHEGSGYALIEACACGAVPVVTDIPPFRAITGAAVGKLWPAGQPAAFARALIAAARLDLAAESRRVADHFQRSLSWEAVARRALAVYADALAWRREGACYTTAQSVAQRSPSCRAVRGQRKHADR